MIVDDVPDLLRAYWRLVQDEEGDWAASINRYLGAIELVRSAPVNGLKEQVEGLPFSPLLLALGHQLNGDVTSSIAVLREARAAIVSDADLDGPLDAVATGQSIEQLRAQSRAATLAAFFATSGASEDALQLFEKLEQAGRPRTLWETLLIARCLVAAGALPSALTVALQGIDQLTARRNRLDSGALRLNFGGRIGPALLNVAASVDLQDGTDEALRLALILLDLGRDRLLAEIVHTIKRAPFPILLKLESIRGCWSAEAEAFQWGDLLSRSLLEKGYTVASRRFQEKLVAAEAGVAKAQAHFQQTAPSIYSMFFAPGRRLLRSPVERTIVDETQRLLSDDTCVLGYDFVEGDVIRWALTRDRLAVTRLPITAQALADHVASVHTSCRNGTLAKDGSLAPLAAALFATADDTLERSTRVLIVPSGPLRSLPFAVLPWRGRPLVSTHACSILPTLGLIRDLAPGRQPVSEKPTIAAFGNPTNMQWMSPTGELSSEPALVHAEREAREVAKLLGTEARCGQLATRSDVLQSLGDANIVHLATHAVFCAEAPLFSAFLLANGEQLSVVDLMAVDGRCSLIVASACRTGESWRTSGDDVLGISRGLLACGATAAVVSLWAIDDAHTADLMVEFYRQLVTGLDPAEALRKAQLTFLNAEHATSGRTRDLAANALPSPSASGPERWWAPFVVVGM